MSILVPIVLKKFNYKYYYANVASDTFDGAWMMVLLPYVIDNVNTVASPSPASMLHLTDIIAKYGITKYFFHCYDISGVA